MTRVLRALAAWLAGAGAELLARCRAPFERVRSSRVDFAGSPVPTAGWCLVVRRWCDEHDAHHSVRVPVACWAVAVVVTETRDGRGRLLSAERGDARVVPLVPGFWDADLTTPAALPSSLRADHVCLGARGCERCDELAGDERRAAAEHAREALN